MIYIKVLLIYINNMTDMNELLKNSKNLNILDFESSQNTKLKSQIVKFVELKSQQMLKDENKIFEFTSNMIFKTFNQNSLKYFNDTIWTMSTSNKKLKTKPILKHLRFKVYCLNVDKTIKKD